MTAVSARWKFGSRELLMDRPILVGVLNVTPDSFSDGGNFFSVDTAVARAEELIAEGADMIDVGGESTRPGALRVDSDEEIRRVIPTLKRIREAFPGIILSIDTVKSTVADASLDAGADVINDVSGLTLDGRMISLAAARGCGVIVMHSRGDVESMATYQDAGYGPNVVDVVDVVASELRARCEAAVEGGVARDAIVVDPGIGFSKRSEDSIRCLAGLDKVASLGFPVLVGISRKRTIVEALKDAGWEAEAALAARDPGTIGANVVALHRGARLFRVHDVRANRAALDVAWRIMRAEQEREI